MKAATRVKNQLRELAQPERVVEMKRFFKTGKGEYGAHDRFRGVCVPDLRDLAKKSLSLSLTSLAELLHSSYHDDRHLALIVLVKKFVKSDDCQKEEIYNFYLENRSQVNNWDLVDCSARQIIGVFLKDKDRVDLYSLAESDSIWDRRIAMVATHAFIHNNEFDDALAIATMLLNDDDDLIHKAVGWMLREIGKRDQSMEEKFLLAYHKVMPRTMLRYSIEHLSIEKKDYYMGRPSELDPYQDMPPPPKILS